MTTAVEHPYLEGHTFRADELGDAVVRGAHWRYACFALMGLCGLALLGNLYQASLPKLVPVYIEVEKESGAMRVVGSGVQTYDLREVTMKKEVREFIERLRRNLDDKVFMGQEWTRLFQHVTPRGHRLLSAYVTDTQPLKRKELVQLDNFRMLMKGERQLDVRWQETTYSPHGERPERATYSGLFVWVHTPPSTLDGATFNPSGILLDTWSFSKEP